MAATILLTGATGLVGFRILTAALEAGHNVRYTVRSQEKAQVVASNPYIQKLLGTTSSERLSAVVIPDFTADGAFDEALKGVTHIIHTGSPVPVPTFEPRTQIFEPTVKISTNLLQSALKTPTIQRVVITSSILANLGFTQGSENVSASTRLPLPDPIPETFSNVMEAYITAKIVEMHNTDTLTKTQKPHFTISYVAPGYVFGRNELALDTDMMQTQNSSNNFLMMAMLGGEVPYPMIGGFVHIDDVAETHLQAAFNEKCFGKDFGVVSEVDFGSMFEIVQKKYPEAVESGVFKKGKVITVPIKYDSSGAKALLGNFKSFETAVADVAGQYLERLETKGQ